MYVNLDTIISFGINKRTPLYSLRETGHAVGGLEEITLEEVVVDIDLPEEPGATEASDFSTHHQRVLSEDDLVGKSANITYNDNLLALAKHMKLPIQQCPFADKEFGVICSGTAPFRVVMTPRGTGVVLKWVSCGKYEKVGLLGVVSIFFSLGAGLVTYVMKLPCLHFRYAHLDTPCGSGILSQP